MPTHTTSLKTTLLYSLLGALLVVYIFFQARFLLAGPILQVNTPTDGATVTESLVTISGSTKNISRITLNDRQIFVDKHGTFSEQLLLPMGYTVFTVAAEDRFGRETKEYIKIVRTEEQPTIVQQGGPKFTREE